MISISNSGGVVIACAEMSGRLNREGRFGPNIFGPNRQPTSNVGYKDTIPALAARS